MSSLSFRRIEEADLSTIYSWLQKPHVREFYHRKRLPSWDEMRANYLQRLDPAWPTKCFLSCIDHPIGYIQTYRIADYPEFAATIGETQGISIDLFIAEEEYVGRGWGRLILRKFLHEISFPLFPQEEVCWIHHEPANQRALRASKAAGFRYVRNFVEEGEIKELLILQKAAVQVQQEGLAGNQGSERFGG
jgi:aminoglycoside 6'-N-acetyltransferase